MDLHNYGNRGWCRLETYVVNEDESSRDALNEDETVRDSCMVTSATSTQTRSVPQKNYLTDFLMMNFNICLYRFPSHLQIRVPLPVRDERLADDLLCVRAANADREE